MGVLDFLSDLSKARGKDELGLGGMRSLLGTRGAAPESKRGEEMMRRTSTDNLPGYFDPETREYVPWYVDLFDGGGLNKSEGLLASAQKTPSAVDMLKTSGAPVQRASQMAPGSLEPFGGAGPNIPEGPLGPFGGAGPAVQDTPDTSYYTPPSSMQMPVQAGSGAPYASTQQGILPQDYAPAERYASSQQGVMPQMQDNMPASTPAPRESTLNTLRENVYSVGPIEAMRNAYNNRPDIPLTQPFAGREDTPRLSEMQSPMMQHPAFPQFVDIMKRMGNESVLQNPEQASFVFNNYLKQIGYN